MPKNKTIEQLAADFSDGMIQHHKTLMGHSIAGRDAVICKMVALLALAYGIPPTRDKPLDVQEAMVGLMIALSDIDRLEGDRDRSQAKGMPS
jgi:hypothetical protein